MILGKKIEGKVYVPYILCIYIRYIMLFVSGIQLLIKHSFRLSFFMNYILMILQAYLH